MTNWKSRWFNLKKYQEYLEEDTILREWLTKKIASSHNNPIEIERSPNSIHIIIRTSRPGILIGRGGEGSTKLKTDIERKLVEIWKNRYPRVYPKKREIKITIEDIKSPHTNASVIGELIVEDLLKRIPFRRIMKQAIEKVSSDKSVKGVKVALSGRLDGSEMARFEWLKSGRIPLQTIRANIDFAQKEALTTYGIIGVKVWIYTGDVFSTTAHEVSEKRS